jgi:hypothetical protein
MATDEKMTPGVSGNETVPQGQKQRGLTIVQTRGKSPIQLRPLGLPKRATADVYRFVVTTWRLVAEQNGGTVTAMQCKRLRSAALAFAESLRAQDRLAQCKAGAIKLTESEMQGWSDRVMRGHAQCDRILLGLGLDAKPLDPWQQMMRQAALPQATTSPSHEQPPQPTGEPPIAPDSATGTPGGLTGMEPCPPEVSRPASRDSADDADRDDQPPRRRKRPVQDDDDQGDDQDAPNDGGKPGRPQWEIDFLEDCKRDGII